METLERFVRAGRILVFGRPKRRWHFVAVQDLARMVVEGYRRPEAVDKRFYVRGPEALTLPEALEAYRRVLDPEIEALRSVPYWLLRVVARLSGNAQMRAGVDATEANALLGAPRITLDRWLQMQTREDAWR